MALVIETGQGLANATSYASVADLRAYAQVRGVTVPTTDSPCEVLLIKAIDRLADENYQGEKLTKAQALPWPRYGVVIEGWPILSNEIPRQLIYCQCAFAVEAQTVDLLPTASVTTAGAIIEETVGPITTRYDNNGIVRRVPAVAKADTLLRLLIRRSGLTAIRT